MINSLTRKHPPQPPVSHGTVLALCIAGVMVVGGFSLAGSQWTDASFPEWLEALSTTAAFLAAVVAAHFAAGVLKVEQHREDIRRKDEAQVQAARLAAWYGTNVYEPTTEQSWRPSRPQVQYGCWVRNASDLPVHNARAAVVIWGKVAAVMDLGLVPPNSVSKFVSFPSGIAHEVSEYLQAIQQEPLAELPLVEITFVDSSSHRWYRDRWGVLAPRSPEEWVFEPAGVIPEDRRKS